MRGYSLTAEQYRRMRAARAILRRRGSRSAKAAARATVKRLTRGNPRRHRRNPEGASHTLWWVLGGIGVFLFLRPRTAAPPSISPPPGNVPPGNVPIAPPSIVADVATMTPDGVLHLSGQAGEVGAFALAVTNTGGAGHVVVSVSPIATTMPPLSMEVCQTDAHGNCLAPAAQAIGLSMPSGGTATFSVFVAANPGQSIALDPQQDAIVVQFSDGAQANYGSSIVPVTTA